jgi:hypothetical protein
MRGHALALGGEREEALKIAQEIEAASEQQYISGVNYCAGLLCTRRHRYSYEVAGSRLQAP